MMAEIIVFLFEGTSMGVMMLFHSINFQQGRLLTSKDEAKKPYTMISHKEFYFFPDEEVNNIDLTNHKSGTDDSARADIE